MNKEMFVEEVKKLGINVTEEKMNILDKFTRLIALLIAYY